MPTDDFKNDILKFWINYGLNYVPFEVNNFEEVSRTLSKHEKLKPENIEKVIFNPPATIVIFTDGTKSVVKCGAEDLYCPEMGLAQALMNIMFDSRSGFKNFIKEKGVFPQNHKKEQLPGGDNNVS